METLHHAYIVFNAPTPLSHETDVGFFLLDKYDHGVEGVKLVYDQISVESVEEIIRAMRIIPRPGSARLVSIDASGVSTSAQNALLKILEEPIQDAFIAIYFSHEIPLLATLLSRVRVIKYTNKDGQDKQVDEFIKASQAERLVMTDKMLNGYKKEKITKGDIINFLEQIIAHFKQHSAKENNPRVQSVLLVETYMRDTNASLKQCLELLALSL